MTKYLNTLRYLAVFEARINGATLEEAGNTIGVKREQARRIVLKITDQLLRPGYSRHLWRAGLSKEKLDTLHSKIIKKESFDV